MKKAVLIITLIALMLLILGGVFYFRSGTSNSPSPSPVVMVTPTPEPTVPKPLAACELLTKDQVSQLVGEALLDPKQSPVEMSGELFHQGCLYLAESGGFTPSVQIDLTYQHLDDVIAIESWWQTTEASDSALLRYSSLSGLGEAAYFSGQSLLVLRSPYVLKVVVSMADPNRNREIAQEIVSTILNQWLQPPL